MAQQFSVICYNFKRQVVYMTDFQADIAHDADFQAHNYAHLKIQANHLLANKFSKSQLNITHHSKFFENHFQVSPHLVGRFIEDLW